MEEVGYVRRIVKNKETWSKNQLRSGGEEKKLETSESTEKTRVDWKSKKQKGERRLHRQHENANIFFFKQKTAYEIRRVLFRSVSPRSSQSASFYNNNTRHR